MFGFVLSKTLLIILVELGLALKLKFFLIFATPVAWSGYILFVDYVNFKITKKSTIFHSPLKFITMFFLSIIMWWMFEWFNIFISNWKYFNLTKSLTIRYIGYFWSFGTILPALLFTAELFKNLKIFSQIKVFRLKVTDKLLAILFLIGLIFLFIPIIAFSSRFINLAADSKLFFWLPSIMPFSIRKYLAAFLWLSFIFIFDPILYLLNKNYSILAEFEKGKMEKFLSLIITGFLCGFLWEFWNFWAQTKWKYFVPILPELKIFEMPILGYFGFPAFAIEMYLIYHFIRTLIDCRDGAKLY